MPKNFNNLRIAIGALIGIALWSGVYCFLPKDVVVVNIAYGAGILGILIFAGTVFMLANGNKANYIANLPFPFVTKGYLTSNLMLNVIVVVLALVGFELHYGVFLLLHGAFLAWYAWKIMVLGAAREAIVNAETKVREQTMGWKFIRGDMDAIVGGAPAEFATVLRPVQEAVRYADPVGNPALQQMDFQIGAMLVTLKDALAKRDVDAVNRSCTEIQNAVRERGLRLKALK